MDAWLRKPTLLPYTTLRSMRFPIRAARPWAHVTKGIIVMGALCCVALISGYTATHLLASSSPKKLASFATKLKIIATTTHSDFCTPPRMYPTHSAHDGFDLMNSWDTARLARLPAQVPCFWAAYHESRLKIPAVSLCCENIICIAQCDACSVANVNSLFPAPLLSPLQCKTLPLTP